VVVVMELVALLVVLVMIWRFCRCGVSGDGGVLWVVRKVLSLW
jgi:hypothetical protein